MIKLKDILLENDTKDRGGVLYSYNGKYLLCLGEASRKWHVPKGHIQKGENPLEGSIREFTEETQISLNDIPELLDSWDSRGGKFHLFKLEGSKKFKPILNHEHTDWGYFSVNELPNPINKHIKESIKKLHNIGEGSPTSNIKGLKGATGFIKPEEWESKKKSLEKNILNSTGYKMIKLKPLLERVDYYDTAQQLVQQYNLRSKIKFTSGSQLAEYVPETDTIYLRRSYKNVKEFLMTILHEIGHALDSKRLGVRKYIKKYKQAGTMANYHGLDPHDDNKWVERAEKFARKELRKWL